MPSSPDEQSHLNGSYYGPSIPPKESRTHRRPVRGGHGSCLRSCFEFLGFCIFQLILQVVLTALLVIGLLGVLFWIIFRPDLVKFNVASAELTQFNLSSTNVLYYGLDVNVTVRNPNGKIGIYYDSIEVRPFYVGQRLDSEFLPPFYQGYKNTSYISGVFQGQQLLSNDALRAYQADKADGLYGIVLKVYLRVRFKVGWFKTSKFKPRVKCGLSVPLNSSGGSFETTKCHLGYWSIA